MSKVDASSEAVRTRIKVLEIDYAADGAGFDAKLLTALLARAESAEAERDEAKAEVARLRERIEPRGLVVVEHDNVGHYVSQKVADIITLLRSDLAAARETIAAKDAEIDKLKAIIYVPGLWKCKKCGFELMQMKLRACDGAVGVRDEPGEHCPNDGAPLWRVTEREAGNTLADRAQEYLQRAIGAEATIANLTAEVQAAREDEAWIAHIEGFCRHICNIVDPNESVADGDVTVWDVLQKEALEISARSDAIAATLHSAERPIPSPDATKAAKAMREVEEAVQAKITEAEIQCAKHAPMGGINYLSWFGRLAGLNYALASIAAAKSKGGEG